MGPRCLLSTAGCPPALPAPGGEPWMPPNHPQEKACHAQRFPCRNPRLEEDQPFFPRVRSLSQELTARSGSHPLRLVPGSRG